MVSLLNGLSTMGQGISAFAGTAGLEAQKSQLSQQTAILADQLATTRESAGRVQAGDIAATAAEKAQAATAANIATEQGGANTRQTAALAATASEGAATRAAEMERELARINAPPDVIKLLRAFGQLPDPTASPASPSGSTAATTPTGASTPPAAPTSAGPDLSNPLVAKALGLPMPGSEDAIRRGIADDVNNDPKFKGATIGQKGAEVENRLAVAKGTMGDPASRAVNAAAIASYQQSPLDQRSKQMAGGPETMAEVMRLNPNYQEGRYPEINKAMAAFATGKQGDTTRFLNVGVQHLDAFDQAAQALKNNDVRAINSLSNYFQEQFGVAAPTTFDGLKQIVATEVEKSIAGGIGASADRDRLLKSLDRASSPQQLQAMTNGFRTLMAGQLKGLKAQYEDATGFKSGPFAFEQKLDPTTIKALGAKSGAPSLGTAVGPTDDTLGTTSGDGPSYPAPPAGFRVIP